MKKLILSLFLCIFILSFVSATPPVLSTVQSGSLEVITPQFNYATAGYDQNILWHVFNTSTLLTNVTTTCYYHLYSQNSKGEDIFESNNVKDFTDGRDFKINISGGNFTMNGQYCQIIECNTSSQTGATELCFQVTFNGNEPPTGNMIIFFGFLFLIICCLFVYVIVYSFGHFLRLDFDVVDLAYNFGIFFGLLGFYFLQYTYWNLTFVDKVLNILLIMGGMMNIVIPLIMFVISITVGSLKKKNVSFGTQKLNNMRRLNLR